MKWLRDPRVLGVALVTSVALNLFLAGVMSGRIAAGESNARQVKRGLEEIIRVLPEAKRDSVRRELRTATPEVRRAFQVTQRARVALGEELEKPQPDRAAIERYFAEVRAGTTAMQQAYQQAFARAAEGLSQEERKALVEAAKRRGTRDAPPEF